MITSFHIEMPPVIEALPALADEIVRAVAEEIRAQILVGAKNKLRSSYSDYKKGLLPVEHQEHGPSVITLLGFLPNALENGWPGGDLRTISLPFARTAKVAEDGTKYMTIFFRHGTGDRVNVQSAGEAYGPARGGGASGPMSAKDAKKFGQRVFRSLGQTGHAPAEASRRAQGHHKRGIYEGAQRFTKQYPRSKGSFYGTFRTLSDNSDPQAFIHPGVEPGNFMRPAMDHGAKAAQKFIASALAGIE